MTIKIQDLDQLEVLSEEEELQGVVGGQVLSPFLARNLFRRPFLARNPFRNPRINLNQARIRFRRTFFLVQDLLVDLILINKFLCLLPFSIPGT